MDYFDIYGKMLVDYGHFSNYWQDMVKSSLDSYLSAAKAAKFLGISKTRLQALLKKNKIKAYICPTSGRKIFHKDDLDQFLNEFRSNEYELA